MALWFECRLRYDKTLLNGKIKKVTETFLIDALTFTEAEARLIAEQTPFISGEFSIPAIKKTNIAEVFGCHDGDKWWLVKYNIITINEKTGYLSRTPVHVIIAADTQSEAADRFNDEMKGTLFDYEIVKVAETPIVQVYPH